MKHIKTLLALSSFTLLALASCSSGSNNASSSCPTCPEASCPTCPEASCPTCPEASCPSESCITCPDVHTHEPGTDYSYDEHGHWHACSGCPDKTIRFNYEVHDYETKDGLRVCKACSYSPDKKIEELFAKFKKGVEAYLNNKDAVTLNCDVVSVEGGNSATMSAMATFDFKNGYAHQQSCYLGADDKKVVASETHLGKSGEQYYYYNGTSSKIAQKTSDNFVDYVYKGFIGEMFSLDYLEILVESPSYYGVAETFWFCNGMVGEFSTDISESQEGAITLSISGTLNTLKDFTYTKNVASISFTVENDFLSGFLLDNAVEYKRAGGNEGSQDFQIKGTVEKSFDQELFDSYVTEGATEDTAMRMQVEVYIGDYLFASGAPLYGTAFEDVDPSRGKLYFDKECTKEYVGTPITSYGTVLYLKPVETAPSDTEAFIVLLEDVAYNRGRYLSPIHDKDADITMAESGTPYHLPWTSSHSEAGQTITVNGVARDYDDGPFTPEAGKVYVVVSSYNDYYGS